MSLLCSPAPICVPVRTSVPVHVHVHVPVPRLSPCPRPCHVRVHVRAPVSDSAIIDYSSMAAICYNKKFTKFRFYGSMVCQITPTHPDQANSIVGKMLNPFLYSCRDGVPINKIKSNPDCDTTFITFRLSLVSTSFRLVGQYLEATKIDPSGLTFPCSTQAFQKLYLELSVLPLYFS